MTVSTCWLGILNSFRVMIAYWSNSKLALICVIVPLGINPIIIVWSKRNVHHSLQSLRANIKARVLLLLLLSPACPIFEAMSKPQGTWRKVPLVINRLLPLIFLNNLNNAHRSVAKAKGRWNCALDSTIRVRLPSKFIHCLVVLRSGLSRISESQTRWECHLGQLEVIQFLL
jgi:hypothetical protein